MSQFVSTKKLSMQYQSFLSAFESIRIPTSVQEALKDQNWVRAMNEQMGALERNETWEIAERPKDKKAVSCRWIFTAKYQSNGTLDLYKVWLVAKGYTQTYEIDYEETFALLTKMNTIRIILFLATHFGLEMHQFDAKNGFLCGSLEEEVYIEIPPGYGATNEGNKVCILRPCMVLNNHLMLGLEDLLKLWYFWGTEKAKVTILCLYSILRMVNALYFWSM